MAAILTGRQLTCHLSGSGLTPVDICGTQGPCSTAAVTRFPDVPLWPSWSSAANLHGVQMLDPQGPTLTLRMPTYTCRDRWNHQLGCGGVTAPACWRRSGRQGYAPSMETGQTWLHCMRPGRPLWTGRRTCRHLGPVLGAKPTPEPPPTRPNPSIQLPC
jgi:hypothetical protein